MITRTLTPLTLSCLRNGLLAGLLFQAAAFAGPREDALMYAQICLSLPVIYRQGCVHEARRKFQNDWGAGSKAASSRDGSWSGRNHTGTYDPTGGCEGGSCVNIIKRW